MIKLPLKRRARILKIVMRQRERERERERERNANSAIFCTHKKIHDSRNNAITRRNVSGHLTILKDILINPEASYSRGVELTLNRK